LWGERLGLKNSEKAAEVGTVMKKRKHRTDKERMNLNDFVFAALQTHSPHMHHHCRIDDLTAVLYFFFKCGERIFLS
jgi:hypothetical protein